MPFKKHNKITTGYVIQEYIELPNGTLVCQNQSFVAGDPVEYEDVGGTPVEVDTTKEVYCPFHMQQPKQIPDPDKSAVFTCPKCGDHRIEAILDGPHTTSIDAIHKGGGIEYGDTYSNGTLEYFQCVNCGTAITDEDGNYITDDDELVEHIEKNQE